MEKKFKGNKSNLPKKNCSVCGKTMTWRKKWKNNWDFVSKCSKRCRSKI